MNDILTFMDNKELLVDFSRVLIFSEEDVDSLNELHSRLSKEIADYKVLDHFFLNEELLAFLRKLKPRTTIHMFSDGALHSLPEIEAGIADIFQNIYTAESIGYKKTNPLAYIAIARSLNRNVSDFIFIDDKQSNVDAANKAGATGVLYTSNQQVEKLLEDIYT